MIDNAPDKIRKAIIQLQKPQPFFTEILMHMKPKQMPENFLAGDSRQRTMAVDMTGNMFFDADWTMSLKDEEVKFVICHEALHVAFQHVARIGSRNPILSNVAQDVIVNMLVTRAGVGEAPTDEAGESIGIPYNSYADSCDLNFGTKEGDELPYVVNRVSEKTWEEVYAELLKFLKENNKDKPKGQSPEGWSQGFDEHMQGNGDDLDENGKPKKGNAKMSKQKQQEMQQKWNQVLADAADRAKKQGNLPRGMDRYVDDLLEPKVDWRTMLMKYIKPHTSPVDWSYHRPNRKSQALGIYLPSTVREGVEIEVVVDTSGSISRQELTEFLSEIAGINRSMQHIQIGVTFWDAADTSSRYELNNANEQDIVDMNPAGGGGTDMEAALRWLEENGHVTPVTVVLTDGYTRFTKGANYGFDVIWVLTETGVEEDTIPYGDVVRMQ